MATDEPPGAGEPVRGRFGREDPSRARDAAPPRAAFRHAGPSHRSPPSGPVGEGGGTDGPVEADRGGRPPPAGDAYAGPPPGTPPPGWEARDDYRGAGDSVPRSGVPDLSSVLALIEGLRGAVPREVQEQLNALVREVLLALRALIDWYLERLERPRAEPEVEDIPIE